jgi:hypothetical protein
MTFGAAFSSAASELEVLTKQSKQAFVYKHFFKQQAKTAAAQTDKFCAVFRKHILEESKVNNVNMDEAFEYLDLNTIAVYEFAALSAQLPPEEVREIIQNLHTKVLTKYETTQPEPQPCE